MRQLLTVTGRYRVRARVRFSNDFSQSAPTHQMLDTTQPNPTKVLGISMMPLCRKDMIMTHRKLHYITDVVTTHTQYHKANVHSRKSLSDSFYIVTAVADPWLSASIFGTKKSDPSNTR